jgi:hypothetical protein
MQGVVTTGGCSYMPVDSHYRLIKTIEDDPEFDTKRARKKLRRYVENNESEALFGKSGY